MKSLIWILMIVVVFVVLTGCATFGTPLPTDHEARVMGIDSQVTDN